MPKMPRRLERFRLSWCTLRFSLLCEWSLLPNIAELVGEIHSQKLRMFMEEYDQQLQEIRTTIDENLAEVWDAQKEPYTIDLEPYESVPLADLVKTDDAVFSQILEVFTGLCEEMRTLAIEVGNILC